jgi:hypothetical protein
VAVSAQSGTRTNTAGVPPFSDAILIRQVKMRLAKSSSVLTITVQAPLPVSTLASTPKGKLMKTPRSSPATR